jgi:putative ABC transport system ATP-binding protein
VTNLGYGTETRETPLVGTPLFELDDLSLAIGDALILDHLTVGIPDHGITVVLGPSGAGKSMVLRLLNRLEVPSSGTVRYRGDDVADLDPLVLRHRVGMVFQRPTPFPGTVRDNLRVAEPEGSDDRFVDLLGRCGLPADFLDRTTDGLSGGEAQRVCLARSLAAEPQVLLMDEPTASLDPENTAAIEQMARDLVSAGLPMVWVTHDLAQAERLLASHTHERGVDHAGAHVLVLIDGRVAEPGEAEAFRSGESGRSTESGNGETRGGER